MPVTGDAFHVYDTTLRDGAQQEGLTLSVADKLTIARHLDELGVGFIEGGWPGANPKDTEFFAPGQHRAGAPARDAGGVRRDPRPGVKAADDPQVAALRDSDAPVVTLVAKAYDRHVELALRTTLDENLGDDPRHRRAPARRGTAGLPRRRALLRRLPGRPGVRRSRWCASRPRPAPTSSCCATPTAACCRPSSPTSSAEVLAATRRPARHPLPRRHRLRRRQHPRRGRRRRHPRAGHGQRLRRAVRQRQPVQRRRQPAAEDGTHRSLPDGGAALS